MVGAAGRGVGKTKLACSLIKRFASQRDIIGIKVTTIEEGRGGCPRGGDGCGVCASMDGSYYISEETDSRAEKDTCRMLAAGAARVLWLRVLKAHLVEGVHALIETIGSGAVSVCESNSLRKIVEPDAFVMVTDKAEQKYKPSAAAVADLADRVVLFDGEGFDIGADDFSLVDGRWTVRIAATAIILAGGSSRRTGCDKSMLLIEGKPIVERIVERLRPWFGQIIVSSNEVEKYGFLGVKVVPDKIAGRGPLMGIASALGASATELNFVVACDIPGIDMAFVRMMIRQARRFDAVVPVTGPMHYEPVFAVYKKSVVEAMEQGLVSGNNKIMEALEHCNVKYIDAGTAARFGNLNTMGDYREFVRRHSDPAW